MTILTSGVVLFASVVFIHDSSGLTSRVEPQDLQVAEGSTVILKCAADNLESNSVYWFRNYRQTYLTKNMKVFHQVGLLLSDFYRRISVVGDTSIGEYYLQIKNVIFADGDSYRCIYFDQNNTFISETKMGELKVFEAPAKGFPKCSMAPDTGLGPGSRVTIQCISARSTGAPNLRLDWHRWAEMLPGTFEQGNTPKATFGSQLTEFDNGAVFTCIESSPVLEVARTCNVTPFLIPTNVTVVPMFGGTEPSGAKKAGSVAIGREALFSCQTQAIPPVSNYTWFVNGDMAVDSTKIGIENGGERLRIRDVQLSDNKSVVECKAWNNRMISGWGETTLHVDLATRSSSASGSPHLGTSNIGAIIGPSIVVIILISIAIYLVVRLRNKKLSTRRGSEFKFQAHSEIRPAIEPQTHPTPTVVVTDDTVSNLYIDETELLSGVTICSTPHAAIVEHLRETGVSTEPEGIVDKDRTTDNTATRVLMVGRLPSTTSDTSENRDNEQTHDAVPVGSNQSGSAPLKRGLKKSQISAPISLSSESDVDSIYVNYTNSNSVPL